MKEKARAKQKKQRATTHHEKPYKRVFVQYRKWSPTANDPETANDSQNGPQMILDRKWSPKLTANDPERKIGMNGLDSS